MATKRAFSSVFIPFLILLIVCPVIAEFRKVQRFKNVEVPFGLKYEGKVLAKDKYDFELIADRSLNMFKLRMAKKGKYLCIIDGEVLRSDAPGARGMTMEEVPDQPSLKMHRFPDKNIFSIIIETGRLTRLFPYYKIQFQMECE